MPEVADLFAERKRVAALAAEMRCPFQTVYSWKRKGDIPPWRRPAVLDAIRRLEIDVSPATLVYLTQGA